MMLATFLWARLDEAEAAARDATPMLRQTFGGDEWGYLTVDRDWFMASIAAQRALIRLVTYLGPSERRPTGTPGRYDLVAELIPVEAVPFWGGVSGEEVLTILARPWAHHPDFQPEWTG